MPTAASCIRSCRAKTSNPQAIKRPWTRWTLQQARKPASDDDTAACKQRYRDAIDEIDAEIRLEYTPEKDAEYKQRLLALTRKLRAC